LSKRDTLTAYPAQEAQMTTPNDPNLGAKMDDVAKYNMARWDALVEANALFTRPARAMDEAAARARVDPQGRLGSVAGKKVLCLAGGGGQQSVAFSLLGAQVTVVDLSAGQLQRDREMAAHYGFAIETVQADMRDLSALPAASFDIVHHPYSLGFVPKAAEVFMQVARVIGVGGIYHFQCANPFYLGMTERDWQGEGYLLRHRYVEGEVLQYADQEWVYDRAYDQSGQPADHAISKPREYRHTLSALVEGLTAAGFLLRHLSDSSDFEHDPNAEPGTWDHFVGYAPPWLHFWTIYRPDLKL
jgi:ubiquinone/menaquinone biosynthesis C-methylase UbiE